MKHERVHAAVAAPDRAGKPAAVEALRMGASQGAGCNARVRGHRRGAQGQHGRAIVSFTIAVVVMVLFWWAVVAVGLHFWGRA